MSPLKPFFSFYGSKYRTAKLYPRPIETKIIEPFAGSACYALHYPNLAVHLNDIDPVIFGVWKYLTRVRASEIRALPVIFDNLPECNIPEEAKWMIGFWIWRATTRPGKNRSGGWARRSNGPYWTAANRERVATQVDLIRHWTVSNESFESLPNARATWFIDPPYQGDAGRKYVHDVVDYYILRDYCRERCGQVIVCENGEASWLPFKKLADVRNNRAQKSREFFWHKSDSPPAPDKQLHLYDDASV